MLVFQPFVKSLNSSVESAHGLFGVTACTPQWGIRAVAPKEFATVRMPHWGAGGHEADVAQCEVVPFVSDLILPA